MVDFQDGKRELIAALPFGLEQTGVGQAQPGPLSNRLDKGDLMRLPSAGPAGTYPQGSYPPSGKQERSSDKRTNPHGAIVLCMERAGMSVGGGVFDNTRFPLLI